MKTTAETQGTQRLDRVFLCAPALQFWSLVKPRSVSVEKFVVDVVVHHRNKRGNRVSYKD
jgi:hypothetical protein